MPDFLQRFIAAVLIACFTPWAALAAIDESLAVGDEIEVTVINSPETLSGYTQRFTLSSDGQISLPLTGAVTVVGKTANQLAAELRAAYRKVFAFAYAGVQVLKRREVASLPVSVYLIGYVRTPGAVPLRDGTPYSLTDLMGTTGGATDMGDLEKVTIYRRNSSVEVINYARALRDGSGHTILLHGGDTVQVPPSWIGIASQYAPILQSALTVIGAVGLVAGMINVIRPAPGPAMP